MSKPSKAVLNAIAAIELYGDTLPHTSLNTRVAAGEFSTFNAELDFSQQPVRFRALTAAGKALLEQSPLWNAAKALEAAGYERDYTSRGKPGFLRYRRPGTTGHRYTDAAWISGGERAYVYTPATNPQYEGQCEATILYPQPKGQN